MARGEVQGLHLFQKHFNYFGHRRLVKQMHSHGSATTGRNPQRFSHRLVPNTFLPFHVFEITATHLKEGDYRGRSDNERWEDGDSEREA